MVKSFILTVTAFSIMVGVVSLAAHSVTETKGRYETLSNR